MAILIHNIPYLESQDRYLRSKWYRSAGLTGHTSRVIPYAEDRISINIIVQGGTPPNLLYFGGPDGMNGQILCTSAPAPTLCFYHFDIDTDPLMTISDMWTTPSIQAPEIIVTEVFCCDDRFA